MTYQELLTTMRAIADVEITYGESTFMKWPDRWWKSLLHRCPNDHVSSTTLLTDNGDRCLAAGCRAPVTLTFPEDEDGPLLAALAKALASPPVDPLGELDAMTQVEREQKLLEAATPSEPEPEEREPVDEQQAVFQQVYKTACRIIDRIAPEVLLLTHDGWEKARTYAVFNRHSDVPWGQDRVVGDMVKLAASIAVRDKNRAHWGEE